MRRLVVALGVLVALAPAARALDHSDPGNHYALRLPSGWRAIPPATIQQFSAETARRLGATPVGYVAGFQLEDRPDFAYPYVLVQVHQVSGLSVEKVAKQFNAGARAEAEKTAARAKDLVTSARLGIPTIDERRKCVLLGIQMGVQGEVVKGLTALFPGKSRAIQINAYTLESEVAETMPVFDAMFDSFRFEAGHGYSPKSAFGGFTFAIVGALVGLVGGIVKRVTRGS